MTLTRPRLAMLNALIILGAMALFALGFVAARAAVTMRAIDDELAAMADRVVQSPPTSTPPAVDVFASRAVFIQAVGLDGAVQMRSSNIGEEELPVDPDSLVRARRGDSQPSFESLAVAGHQLRTYQRPVVVNGGLVSVVEVATPIDTDLPRGPVLAALIAGVAIGVIGAVALGWLLARIALAPVDRLAATVDSISSTDDLSRRLPVDDFGALRLDSVVRLTHAFNGMLDRLQMATEQVRRSLHHQRQFVGDASHQLRTPLTSLRGNVDLLSRMCAEDCPVPAMTQHQEVLSDMTVEADRMSRMVNSLLLLARADAQQHLSRAPVQLEPLINDAYRTARSLSDSVSVELGEVPSGMQVRADPDRLVQLLTILLENAVAYSPPGGRVRVRALPEARYGNQGVAIEVADSGPGVAVEERARIFERFYRSQRTALANDGVGLGLAVARWIALEHDAEIRVMGNQPVGSVFQVWLPIIVPGTSPHTTD